MMNIDFTLSRNAFGALEFERAGARSVGVVPVRAFPVVAPQQGISLVTSEGNEFLWIDSFDDLPSEIRQLLESELSAREFMPEIRGLHAVSSCATPCTWQVATDRGDFNFILRGEEDIRRLAHGTLLISDSHGVQFLIRDLAVLDRNSRRLLDRFL